jgi:NADPH:quinone reductase-like Zn-dependent oxidoreductase
MRSYHIQTPGSADGLVLRSGEEPVPGPHEILVRVRASSLNHRDLLVLEGATRSPVKPGTIPLSDGAGEVVQAGERVTRVRAGDRVASVLLPLWTAGRWHPRYFAAALGTDLDGMLTEVALLSEQAVVTIPGHLSFAEAATLPTAGLTAWSALTSGTPVISGETVLTQGSGNVSVFALQLARLAGARVISTTSSAGKAARLRAIGADDVIDTSRTPDWDKAVRERTGGQGADCIIDVGGPATLGRSLRAVRAGGQIQLVGSLAGPDSVIDVGPLVASGITLRSITLGSRESFEDMNRAIAASRMRPVIDRAFAFEQAREAFQHFRAPSRIGKVVIEH